MRTENKNDIGKGKSSRGLLLPLVLRVAVIPLIVFMKEYPTHLEEYAWVSVNEANGVDFFN